MRKDLVKLFANILIPLVALIWFIIVVKFFKDNIEDDEKVLRDF